MRNLVPDRKCAAIKASQGAVAIFFVLMSSLFGTTAGHAVSCPVGPQSGPQFDRCPGPGPTCPERAQVCSAIKSLSDLSDALSVGINAYQQRAADDMAAFAEVTFDEAINPAAVQSYQSAGQLTQRYEQRLNAFVQHPQCGSTGAMDQIRQFFDAQRGNLQAGFEIGAATARSGSLLRPALGDLALILRELDTIRQEVSRKAPAAAKEIDAIVKAVSTVKVSLEKAAGLDISELAAAAGNSLFLVGPYLTNCNLCIGLLQTAATSMLAGTGVGSGSAIGCAGGTAAAAGGSCWGMSAFSGNALGVMGGAVASASCSSAVSQTQEMGAYLITIAKFVQAATKLSKDLVSASTAIVRASAELGEIAVVLRSETADNVGSAQAGLLRVAATIDTATDDFVVEVMPRAERLTLSLLEQTGENVEVVVECYNHLQDFTLAVAGDTGQALLDFAAASATLIEADQVIANLAQQTTAAVNAARREARDGYNTLAAERADLYSSLWGVPFGQTPNLVQTVVGLSGLVLNPVATINTFNDAAALTQKEVGLVGKAFAAAKTEFLSASSGNRSSLNRLSATASTQSQQALTGLQNAGPLPPGQPRFQFAAIPRYEQVPSPRPASIRPLREGLAVRASKGVAVPARSAVSKAEGSPRVERAGRVAAPIADLVADRFEGLPGFNSLQAAVVAGSPVRVGTLYAGNSAAAGQRAVIRVTVGPDDRCVSGRNQQVFARLAMLKAQVLTALPITAQSPALGAALVPQGRLFLTAEVDADNRVTESDESNNCQVVTLR